MLAVTKLAGYYGSHNTEAYMRMVLDTVTTREILQTNEEALRQNEYPGRFIAMGVNEAGTEVLQAYALMGRISGSRNRIFEEDVEGIRTVAPTLTPKEMVQQPMAELIYYRAMRGAIGNHIVSNGAQTDPVFWRTLPGSPWNTLQFEEAIDEAPILNGVSLNEYEPDEPNYTPRITGQAKRYSCTHSEDLGLSWGVIRRGIRFDRTGKSLPVTTTWHASVHDILPGVGYAIQTYAGNGDPLPSFTDEPYALPFTETREELAHNLWAMLNADNKVALVTKSIDIASGESTGYTIINKHEESVPVGLTDD